MENKRLTIQKNVLDLEHSEKLTRGVTKMGVALTGFVTIFLTLHETTIGTAIVAAGIWSLMFWLRAQLDFEECRGIRDKIKRLA